MTGRRQRSRGGGRGRGGRSSGRRSANQAKAKKSITDYMFYIGTATQAADYETTAAFIINHIKKTFTRGNDIAESLRMLQEPITELWKPDPEENLETDEEKKKLKAKLIDMEHKARLDLYLKREETYLENRNKAYALLWERCHKNMQDKLQARADFESSLYNNPIMLGMLTT